jgi:hypothetical protein
MRNQLFRYLALETASNIWTSRDRHVVINLKTNLNERHAVFETLLMLHYAT